MNVQWASPLNDECSNDEWVPHQFSTSLLIENLNKITVAIFFNICNQKASDVHDLVNIWTVF